jgi:PKD repeat protein
MRTRVSGGGRGVLCLALGLHLLSCGGDPGPTSSSTPAPAPTATPAWAVITPIGTGIAELTTFRFDASASSGADTYTWDLGDGQKDSGSLCEHTYAAAGSYSVSLTVTRGGRSTTASIGTVSVAPTVTGVWDVTFSRLGNPFVYHIEQDGPKVGGVVWMMRGTPADATGPLNVGPIIDGALPDGNRSVLPAPISFTGRWPLGGYTFTFVGTYATPSTIVGTVSYGDGILRRR